MYSEKKEVKVTSSLPHYMIATAASKQHQPSVKKEEKKTEKKRRVASVPCVKKEKTEAGIPSYMRSTASSRAMGGEKPLKKEEKRLAPSFAMKGEMRGKAVPHYLKPTASSRAKEVTLKIGRAHV